MASTPNLGDDNPLKRKKSTINKMRVGLEKPKDTPMQFPADAPGRVIVRLERLMGTDRIRITDLKYMATLLQRLEEDEDGLWRKRTWERRKSEHNRYRRLVIEGLTEPGPGMEDLQNHPIFRVNRILNRLLKLDTNTTPILHLPPISPVEPFEDDVTGGIFKTYPGHILFAHELEMQSRSHSEMLHKTYSVNRSHHVHILEEFEREHEADGSVVSRLLFSGSQAHEEEPDDEEEKEVMSKSQENLSRITSTKQVSLLKPETENEQTKPTSKESHESSRGITLLEIQKKYGVAPNTDLGVSWNPYRSEIVDTLYTDERTGVLELYEMGEDVIGVYNREQIITDDYINSITKPLKPEEIPGDKMSDKERKSKEKAMYKELYEGDEFWQYINAATTAERDQSEDEVESHFGLGVDIYGDDGYLAEAE